MEKIEEKIQHDYFFQSFREYFNELICFYFISCYGIDEGVQLYIWMTQEGDAYAKFPILEERPNFYDQALLLMCQEYCDIEKIHFENYEKNAFAFVKQILETIPGELYSNDCSSEICETSDKIWTYPESFLYSLQMIFSEYFSSMGKGCLDLWISSEKVESHYEVTINSRNEITKCESFNMDQVEETETLLRVLILERNGGIGPIKKVVPKYDERI